MAFIQMSVTKEKLSIATFFCQSNALVRRQIIKFNQETLKGPVA